MDETSIDSELVCTICNKLTLNQFQLHVIIHFVVIVLNIGLKRKANHILYVVRLLTQMGTIKINIKKNKNVE
jgi:hypothetical protein